MESVLQTSANMPTEFRTSSLDPKMRMRKRTKTGCLTCRKRRIRCGEERPTCQNCVKSKRQCEGYNQRVIFKAPLGDWPNHPGVVNTIQYHSSMLPSHFPRRTGMFPDVVRTGKPSVSADLDSTSFAWPTPMDLEYFLPEFKSVDNDISTFPESEYSSSSPTAAPVNHRGLFFLTGGTPAEFKSKKNMTLIRKKAMSSFLADEKKKGGNSRASVDSSRLNSKVSDVSPTSTASDMNTTDLPGPAFSSWAASDDVAAARNNHPDLDQVEVVEYLDDDYYDVVSDEDSAICMQDDYLFDSAGEPGPHSSHPSMRFFDHPSALDFYRPQHTANPLKDVSVARFFAVFIQSVGPSLSFGPDRDPLFTYQVPYMALTDLALLHALLSLTTLHVASLQSASRTPSYKHYAYSLKRLGRAITNERKRLQPSTLATCLLLAEYEFLSGEHTKWGCHLVGVSQLIKELNLWDTAGTSDAGSEGPKDQGYFQFLERVGDSHKMREGSRRSLYRDMIWYTAKQDTYHAILCGKLLTPLEEWKQLLSEASREPQEGLHWDGLLSNLMDIAHFGAEEREKKQNSCSSTGKTRGMATPYASTEIGNEAFERWLRLKDALECFQEGMPEGSFYRRAHARALRSHPNLASDLKITWQDPKTARFWAMFYMGELLLARSHPGVPHDFIPSLVNTRLSTASCAERIGQMVRAIVPRFEVKGDQITPDLRGALNDCILPLYIAAVQYDDAEWRSWTIQTFSTIAKLTGWHLAMTASVAVQHVWVQLGSENSWTSIVERTMESETYIACSSSWGLFDDHSWRDAPNQPSANMHNSSSVDDEDEREKSRVWEASGNMLENASSSHNVRERDEYLKKAPSTREGGLHMSEALPMTITQPSPPADGHCNSVSPTDAYSDSYFTDQSGFSSEASGSSEEESERSVLRIRQREMIDRVMNYFHLMLRVKSPSSTSNFRTTTSQRVVTSPRALLQGTDYTQTNRPDVDFHARHSTPYATDLSPPVFFTTLAGSDQNGSTSSGDTSDTRHCTTEMTTALSSRSLGKRPRNDDDDEGFQGDDNGAPSKRQKGDGASTSISEKKRKFACPYFKRNPEKYLATRSCVGPGWEEVRRVKEHLYRNHTLPIFCARCYETFKSDVLLHAHQRKEEPCETRPRETVEGVDKEQEKKLRSRKKTYPELTEENKWKEMYRLLFPSDDEMMMPSPYLDEDWEKMYQKSKQGPSNELARYEQFLRRELPPAVRRELEVAVEREFYPMEERLKSQLVDIVRDLQLQLFQSYTHSRNPALITSPEEDSIQSTGCIDQVTQQDCQGETLQEVVVPTEPLATTIEEQLASYEPPPPLAESIDFDFDAVRFQLDEWSRDDLFWDSTYGSDEVNSFWDGLPAIGDYKQNPNGYFFDNGEGPSERR